jgi:hypothetical protein
MLSVGVREVSVSSLRLLEQVTYLIVLTSQLATYVAIKLLSSTELEQKDYGR